MNNNYLKLEKIDGNIYHIIFDNLNEKLNIIDEAFLKEYNEAISTIEADNSATGVILSSAKKDSFIVGADIKTIGKLQEGSILDAYEASLTGRSILAKIRGLKIPSICLINGMILGGGLELSLFCSYRIASASSNSVLGLPEVKLGILPAWGGCINLPRLIGQTNALKIILNGDLINFTKAHRLGIIDELSENDQMFERASNLIKTKSVKTRSLSFKDKILASLLKLKFFNNFFYNKLRQFVKKTTKGFYPAPLKIIDVVKNIGIKSESKLYELESLAFSELLFSHECKSILNIYFAQTQAKKIQDNVASLKTIGVIGAGVMGAGIAQALAYANYKVILKEVNQEFLDKGIGIINNLFESLIIKKKLSKEKASQLQLNIKPSLDYADFSECDLIIEAVIEDFDTKLACVNEVSKVNSKNFIFATNTSSLSVEDLAKKSTIKDRLIGIHFFNPVHKMNLVEIIKTSFSDTTVLDQAKSLVLKLNKTPVLAKSSPGFIVNRILGPYMLEAVKLAIDKVSIEKTDKAVKKFGLPMGPFELLDEVGLDIAYKVSQILHAELGDRMQPVTLLNSLIENKALGKKTKIGIYEYDENLRRVKVNPNVCKLIFNADEKTIIEEKLENPKSDEEITDRLIMVMLNEAIRLLASGVVEDAASLDLAMVFGTGFAPHYGGLIKYADYIGLETIYQKLSTLCQIYGENYAPQPILLELIAKKQNFYEVFKVNYEN